MNYSSESESENDNVLSAKIVVRRKLNPHPLLLPRGSRCERIDRDDGMTANQRKQRKAPRLTSLFWQCNTVATSLDTWHGT